MAQVGIVMGSDSDMPIMAKAADILDQLGVSYEMTIISAHREPDVFFEYAKSAEEKGFKVIIAGAGMAAHLPGMCAAIFPMPVLRNLEQSLCVFPRQYGQLRVPAR
jgi:5-(carboxyamino)imidazole ribonucleotide mutase